MQKVKQNDETKKYVPKERTGENSKKYLNKMESSNLADTEFKILVIRMLKELSENFNKDIENIKKRSYSKLTVINNHT